MHSTLSADLTRNKGVKAGKLTPEAKANAVINTKLAKIQKAKTTAARSVNKWL
jgi:hypothetical protein